jgi:hypothetical protein
MLNDNKPGTSYAIDLHGGGTLILDGDTSIEMTIMDADGNGGALTFNETAAEQISNALFHRAQLIQAKLKKAR